MPSKFSHPFIKTVTRNVNGVAVLEELESAVYSVETGERRLVWPIDGKEMVKTGGWSWEPVEPKAAEPEAQPESVSVSAPVAEAFAPAPEFKRGPGRPRKTDIAA